MVQQVVQCLGQLSTLNTLNRLSQAAHPGLKELCVDQTLCIGWDHLVLLAPFTCSVQGTWGILY